MKIDETSICQGTNCGTTTGDHSPECLAEAAASQGWELKPEDLGEVEVVAYLATAEHPKHGQAHKAINYFKDPHDAQVAHWRERGCTVTEDQLMTVSQHASSVALWADLFNRVQQERDAAMAEVGALRAELETERMRLVGCGVAALGYFDGCADSYKSASLSDVLRLRADCDAALARVAEWRAGIARAIERASVFDDGSDGADAESARSVVAILSELLASAPPAQAQHSAPAAPKLIGWRTDNYLWETSDPAMAKNWEPYQTILPIFEGDPYTKLKAPVAQAGQTQQGLELKAEGEANRYCLLKDGRWLASILMNGEMLVAQQEDFLRALISAEPAQQEVTDAARDVLAERRRQVDEEGWTPEHDDEHACDEIAAFACFYAMPPAARDWDASSTGYGDTLGEAILPEGWESKTGDRRRELVKAGGLILAEIERLDRAATSEGGAE